MNQETSSGINPLVAEVIAAANGVRSQIRALDDEVATLQKQRQDLIDPPISRADFMEYVREDISRQSKVFPAMLKTKFGNGRPFGNNFEKLERVYAGHGKGLQAFPYFNWSLDDLGFKLEPAAFYWYFTELIQERFELAIQDFDWPTESMPVAERRERIKKIDAQISDLTARRRVLQGQLMSALSA
jgi:uncharacterized coiled-coil protein SlyX